MNTHAIRSKSVPWYREPWPWILIALPLSAVIAGFVTLIIAIENQDGLVAEDYYKQGLAINRVLERESRATALGLTAQLMISEKRIRIRIDGRTENAGAVVVRFIHPTRSGEDRAIVLRSIATDWYEGVMPGMASGRWHLQLEDAQATWRLTTEWTPGQEMLSFAAPEAS